MLHMSKKYRNFAAQNVVKPCAKRVETTAQKRYLIINH